MKIQFVGAGSAFNKEDGQSNALVIADNGKKLLIDCGCYCWQFMQQMEPTLGVTDIEGVYVSHLHADHVGGLEELAFCTYFNPSASKPKLYGNFRLMHDLWEQSLRGGLESVQAKQMDLDSYFDVLRIPDNGEFIWEGIGFKPVQTVHVVNDCTIKVSYGLLIRDGMQWTLNKKDTINIGKPQPTVFFTTDTQFCPNQISDFYARADIIFHDCETSPFKSGVHAHYSELATLSREAKEKMVLYHYQPNPPQKQVLDIEPRKDGNGEVQTRTMPVYEDGFLGFANAAQTFDITWDEIKQLQGKVGHTDIS